MRTASAFFYTAAGQMAKMAGALLIIKMIALDFGPAGLGKLGQVMSLVAIINIIATGGIFSGVIKLAADVSNRQKLLSSALIFCLTCSVATALAVLFGAEAYAIFALKEETFEKYLQWSALLIPFVGVFGAVGPYLLGIGQVRNYNFILVGGSILGVIGFFLLNRLFQIGGAVIGLFFFAASAGIFVVLKYGISSVRLLGADAFRASLIYTKDFAPFVVMSTASVFCLNVGQYCARLYLEKYWGWLEVGYWQANVRFSDAYMQIILVFLSGYLLPKLSKIHDLRIKLVESLKGGFIVTLLFLLGSSIILPFSDIFIGILFSSDFVERVSPSVSVQLVADYFKALTFCLVLVLTSQGNFKIYLIFELLQLILYLIFMFGFTPTYGVRGAVWAGLFSSATYLTCVACTFHFVDRRSKCAVKVNI